MIGVEQKFDLVFENYADYERELLDLSLHQALRRDLDWPGSQNDIAAVSRRLANLLSAARLYLDQINHDLRATFGPTSDVPRIVKAKTAEQYDARFGYRLMYSLRNAVQHRSMPVHALSYSSESVGQGLQFRAIPSIDVVRLKDAKLKPAVFAELESRGETVELTPLVRSTLRALATSTRRSGAWQHLRLRRGTRCWLRFKRAVRNHRAVARSARFWHSISTMPRM